MAGKLTRSQTPFDFFSRLNLTLLTGKRAQDLAELTENLKTVPGAVIYHHTHHFLFQHQYLSPEPPNDFAYWVANVLLEERLGEELAAIDVLRFATIRELREALVATIQHFMETTGRLRAAPPGEEFHFMQSVSFVMPTGQRVHDLKEFRDTLSSISLASIAYHMFDARLRLEQGDNDFSKWLEKCLGEAQLAAAVRRVDPYTHTEDGLRKRLMALVDGRIAELRR